MILLEAARVAVLMTPEMLDSSAKSALISAADGTASLNAVVIGRGFEDGQSFSIKSGGAALQGALGLKVGAYWPGNTRHGLPRHGSTIVLIDPDTGRVEAMVEAGMLNGPRTAAVNARASDALARRDSRVLGIIGAGNQARHEILALTRIRPITRALVASRSPAKAAALCAELASSVTAELIPVTAEEACREADIITTVTPSRVPLIADEWIKPGTHVSSMGSDQSGKQELPPALLERASLFCDFPPQSISIGEFQHIRDAVLSGRLRLTSIGDVLRGTQSGRTSDCEITVFDSSGIALQDLILAARLIEAEKHVKGAVSDHGTESIPG